MADIAVIGAGMTGLAAARTLSLAGHRVTLFEKNRALGGRVATRRIHDCIVDHGAQVIKPGDTALAALMTETLSTADLLRVPAPVRIYTDGGELLPLDPERAQEKTYTYRYGLTTLAKLIARELPTDRTEMRFETRIGAIDEIATGVLLRDDRGEEVAQVDRVILTAPAPQAADLLAASYQRNADEAKRRIDALRSVSYNPCLSVLLGYVAPVPEAPAYALLAQNRSRPLLWVAFEQTKAPERAPQGEAVLIAQLGPEISRSMYVATDEEVIAVTLQELRSLFAEAYATPTWSQVKRWRYSQPQGHIAFSVVNSPEHRVLCCGDALRPENGRVHQAYLSGLEAAQLILA